MQYVTTADGVRIAFAVAGHGWPVLRVPNAPFSHCQLEWRFSTFYDRLAERWMVIPFDPRDTGLSDRGVQDVSLEARLLDLDAVVARVGLERFAVHGIGFNGSLAIAYAVRHPERVSHLILDDSFARPADYLRTPRSRALAELAEDWDAFTEHLAFMAYGLGREEARPYVEFFNACVNQEDAIRMFTALRDVDVTDLLSQVGSPTLVCQHTGGKMGSLDASRELASRIPNAELVVVEGTVTETNPLVEATERFLDDAGGQHVSLAAPAPAATADFRAILFTDVVESTPLTRRLGDVRGRELLRQHDRLVREALRAYGGVEVKTMGDGFMASFPSVGRALDCASAIQQAVADENRQHPDTPVQVRVGVNAGEPITEDEDLFGTAVILAARIAGLAAGGEILASSVVRELVAGKGFLFADRGETVLRGFEDPVRLYQLLWSEREPFVAGGAQPSVSDSGIDR